MIGYAMYGTNDAARAHGFYDAVLGSVGIGRLMEFPTGAVAYGVAWDKPMLAIGAPYDGKPASVGNGAMMSLVFDARAKVDAIHVPYKGSGPLLTDLIGGQIDYSFDTMTAATPHVKSGKVIAIAQTRQKRAKGHPTVPTMAESGFAGFEATTWFALFAPAGTPRDVVLKLNAEVQRVFKLPDVADKLKGLGLEPWLSTPEELAAYQAKEIVKWAKVVKDSGAKAD